MHQKILNKLFLILTSIALVFGLTSFYGDLFSTTHNVVLADKKPKKDKDTDKDKDKDPKTKDDSDDDGAKSGSSGGDGQGDQYSFYHLASSAATYFDGSQNPDTKVKFMDGKSKAGKLTMNNAGGLVGYEDPKYDTKNWMGSFTSTVSHSSQGHSYSTYRGDGGKDNPLQSIYLYTLYGHALSSMGLDSTAPKATMSSTWRKLLGGIMLIAYALAAVIPILFAAVGKILQMFNPFQFFDGGHAISNFTGSGHYQHLVHEATTSAHHAAPGVGKFFWSSLGGLTDFFGKLYDDVANIGLLVIIPCMIMFVLLGYLLWNYNAGASGVGQKLKRIFIRLFVIVAGIPLLADTYTQFLNHVTASAENDETANIILASTYDDFENWAAHTRLALPAGTKIGLTIEDSASNASRSGSINTQSNSARHLALRINYLANTGLFGLKGQYQDYNLRKFWGTSQIDHDATVTNNYSKGMTNLSGAAHRAQMGAGFSMLQRYMNSSTYEAADYETMYKSHLSTAKLDKKAKTVPGDNRQAVLAGIKYLAANPDAFQSDKKAYFADTQADPKDTNNGTAKFLHNGGRGVTGSISNTGGIEHVLFRGHGRLDTNGKLQNSNWGLSSLAMYNYLSTAFTDSNIICYSSSNSTSQMVSDSHHSVNLVGTQAEAIGYYINALVLFLAIIVIGWGYAIGMLMNGLSNSMRIIAHVFPALLGSMAGVAKLITAVFVMILQIGVTVFLYSLIMDLLTALNYGVSSITDPIFYHATGGGTGGMIMMPVKAMHFIPSVAAATSGQQVSTIGTIGALVFSTACTGVFAIMAYKLRSQISSAAGQWIGDVTDRICGSGKYNGSSNRSVITNSNSRSDVHNHSANSHRVGGSLSNHNSRNGGLTKMAEGAGMSKLAQGHHVPGVPGARGGHNGFDGGHGPAGLANADKQNFMGLSDKNGVMSPEDAKNALGKDANAQDGLNNKDALTGHDATGQPGLSASELNGNLADSQNASADGQDGVKGLDGQDAMGNPDHSALASQDGSQTASGQDANQNVANASSMGDPDHSQLAGSDMRGLTGQNADQAGLEAKQNAELSNADQAARDLAAGDTNANALGGQAVNGDQSANSLTKDLQAQNPLNGGDSAMSQFDNPDQSALNNQDVNGLNTQDTDASNLATNDQNSSALNTADNSQLATNDQNSSALNTADNSQDLSQGDSKGLTGQNIDQSQLTNADQSQMANDSQVANDNGLDSQTAGDQAQNMQGYDTVNNANDNSAVNNNPLNDTQNQNNKNMAENKFNQMQNNPINKSIRAGQTQHSPQNLSSRQAINQTANNKAAAGQRSNLQRGQNAGRSQVAGRTVSASQSGRLSGAMGQRSNLQRGQNVGRSQVAGRTVNASQSGRISGAMGQNIQHMVQNQMMHSSNPTVRAASQGFNAAQSAVAQLPQAQNIKSAMPGKMTTNNLKQFVQSSGLANTKAGRSTVNAINTAQNFVKQSQVAAGNMMHQVANGQMPSMPKPSNAQVAKTAGNVDNFANKVVGGVNDVSRGVNSTTHSMSWENKANDMINRNLSKMPKIN